MRTYGTAELKNGYWIVECEPHVMLRLKRMFGGVSKSSMGVVKMKATDEISRDLLWFTQRFALEVKQPEELDRRAQRHIASCESFERLISGQAQPQHFDLSVPPRDYQRVAASLMLEARGLLLGDEVGVGKTTSAICALTDPRTRPALVVTLTHLPTQWEREIKRFCPRLRTHVIKKGTPYDVRGGARNRKRRANQVDLLEPEFPDVLIINYHKLRTWAETLAGVVRSITFDEGQELRRSGSKGEPSAKYEAAMHVAKHCDFRWALTATPIYNYGIEFYNVLAVLRPDALGERAEFIREWCVSDGDADKAEIKDPKAFGTYLRESGLMLRRTRKDVARELPAITRGEYHCDTDDNALAEAEDAAAELARIILAKDTAWSARGQATRDLDWRLRQATGVAKAAHVASFVKMLVESGEKVVLYGWHREVYALWLAQLRDLHPVMFTGSESPTQKEAAREAFVNGDAKVLIMSLRAGAGLDGLQYVCRTVVFGELDWSPGVHHQAEGRVFRDGQADPVSVYYLVSDSGSDPFLSETLGLKRGQIESVIDPDAELVTQLSSNAADGIRRIAEKYLEKSRGAQPLEADNAATQPAAPTADAGA